MELDNFTNNNLIIYKLDHGWVEYCDKFLSPSFSKKLFESLTLLNYEQSKMFMVNKTVLTPRLQAWMGDPNINCFIVYKTKFKSLE